MRQCYLDTMVVSVCDEDVVIQWVDCNTARFTKQSLSLSKVTKLIGDVYFLSDDIGLWGCELIDCLS